MKNIWYPIHMYILIYLHTKFHVPSSIGSLIITVTLRTNDVCMAAMLFYIVQKHCFRKSSYSSKVYYDATFKDPTF